MYWSNVLVWPEIRQAVLVLAEIFIGQVLVKTKIVEF